MRAGDCLALDAVDDTIGSMGEGKPANSRGASRYDPVIATLVGFCALCVSGYTAYIQRQQVRGAVWPILQFDSGNAPIRFILANKGVGPAIIKNVIVRVDDQPVKNWVEVLDKILWPGYHPGESSDMRSRVFSAGASMNVFTPHDDARNPIAGIPKFGSPAWRTVSFVRKDLGSKGACRPSAKALGYYPGE